MITKLVFASEPKETGLDEIYVPTKTKVILRGEEKTLNGRTYTKQKDCFDLVETNFEEEFLVYHSLAVLATFLDLLDDPRKEVHYSSKGRHIPEKREVPADAKPEHLWIFQSENSWNVSIALSRKNYLDLDDQKWFNYTAGFKEEEDDGTGGLPLLSIKRWYAYDDAAEGYTPYTDREYLVQLHKPSEGDFLGKQSKKLEEILKDPRFQSPIVSGGRTPYNHTDNKGVYTLEEVAKEPEVRVALITLVKTHPEWKDKPLTLFGDINL